MVREIGLFGASFNPPTIGHQNAIHQALDFFDEILLVPSILHPFGKNLAKIEHRLEMLSILVKHWPKNLNEKIKIFNIETMIKTLYPDCKAIYTYHVLNFVQELYQCYHHPFRLRFIIGPDLAKPAVWQKFYRYQTIEQQWPLFIVNEMVHIHSTMVRELIVNPCANLKRELAAFVDEEIADYILKHSLYR